MPFKQSIEFATTYYDDFVKLGREIKSEIVICPSFESLYPISEMFKSTKISVGAQDCSHHSNGSFTGQILPQSLHEIGCNFCIVGHSEARAEFSQTDDKIAQKFTHLLDYDVTPVLCIGETKEEHKAGKTLAILEKQLSHICETICKKTSVHTYLTPCVAYEPIWSIGTDNIATTDHLDTVFTWLRGHLEHNCPEIQWNLLYGGSTAPNNIAKLKQINEIDGFLIGKASLDFQKLQKIVK